MVTEWRRPTKDEQKRGIVAFRIAYHISSSGLRLNADESYTARMIMRRMKRDINSLPYWITPLL